MSVLLHLAAALLYQKQETGLYHDKTDLGEIGRL